MILNLFVIWSFSPFHGPFQFILFLSLQYFTVLPTEIFRRYVIKSLLVIYFYWSPYRQNTSVCNTTIHRYIGRQHKKTFADGFTDRNCVQKKFSRLKYTDGFIPSVIVWYTDGYISSVKLSGVFKIPTEDIRLYIHQSLWQVLSNTDRLSPSVELSVSVKYRPNISICKVVDDYGSYCQMPTDIFRR